jgi:hypothetical protein
VGKSKRKQQKERKNDVKIYEDNIRKKEAETGGQKMRSSRPLSGTSRRPLSAR